MACHAVQFGQRPTAHFTPLRSLRGQNHRNITRPCCAAYCGLRCKHKSAGPRLGMPNKQTGIRSTDFHVATKALTCVERCILCRASNKAAASASRWQVPWGLGQVTRLMLQIWALEAINVPLLTQLRGLRLAETSMSDKATTAAAVQFLKLLGALLLVQRALKPYKPLPRNWFKYEVNGEAVGLGISGGVTALCLTLLTAAVTGGAAAQNTGTVKTLLGDGQTSTVAAIAAASVVGSPLLEEYTYRGFLLPSLTKWMPTPAAVLAQAVIFAGSHLSPGDLLPLTALGVCLGTVTVAAEGNLVGPVLAHALYNGAVLYVLVR